METNVETNSSAPEAKPRAGGDSSSSALFGIWIEVEKEKPKPGRKVLVCGKNEGARSPYRALATWQPKGTLDAEMWDEPPEDWWDETDSVCANPNDGWWEEPVEIEQIAELNNVTHWMPLPGMPNDKGEGPLEAK